MANEQTGDKKLHIDSDWKAQVQAEKERLERETRQREAADAANRRKRESGVIGGTATGTGSAEEGHEAHELPPASFEVLIQSLATQAMMFLNPQRDPKTGRSMQNLDLAKHTIDLLAILEEKTRGNLSEEEKKLLDTVLYEMRMAYVQASRVM
jgi:hypothetical protein